MLQMFSVHTTPEELKTRQSPVILDLCLRKARVGKSHDYCDYFFFQKLRFQNVFRPYKKMQSVFNSSGLKSVFEKLRFRDGLVWTVYLNVETMLRFQISPAQCGCCLKQRCLPSSVQNFRALQDGT